jgi:hypothetical protein
MWPGEQHYYKEHYNLEVVSLLSVEETGVLWSRIAAG